jgi:hypothetical protein
MPAKPKMSAKPMRRAPMKMDAEERGEMRGAVKMDPAEERGEMGMGSKHTAMMGQMMAKKPRR